MKSIIISAICLLGVFSPLNAQKYFSKTARVAFLSEAPLENIKSVNNNGYVITDATTGVVEVSVLIKGFTFDKALMQEHFNENYMESTKYPKAIFKGKITNLQDIRFTQDGEYNANVQGSLTLHGVTKPITVPATISVKSCKVTGQSSFDIALEDYGITIPKVVRENISKTVKVSVITELQKM